ncbi:hypothetical protein [Bacillus phage SDFMU_Pbc]|uniref:Uncharacterized protein n=1 Tax=Bacillus phage SDFMU_Pbc TaxID=3076135 RepID=A0AA96KRB3_9CAUD|nr:hypothetical protein [Bacillus phage SDFMU_Pbc]
MDNTLNTNLVEDQMTAAARKGYKLPITMDEYDAIRAKYPPVIRLNVGFIILGQWDMDRIALDQRPLTKQMLIEIGLPEAALTKAERDALEKEKEAEGDAGETNE